MKKIAVAAFALFLLVATGCKKEKLPNEKLPECPDCAFSCLESLEPDVLTNACFVRYTCSFLLRKDSRLIYSESNTESYVRPGSKLVFSLASSTQGAPNIADDEITEVLYFELEPGMESFSAEAGQMDLLNLRFQRHCYCYDTDLKKPTGGCMQGQRIDDSHWKVQGNLTFSYDFGTVPFKFEAVFSE